MNFLILVVSLVSFSSAALLEGRNSGPPSLVQLTDFAVSSIRDHKEGFSRWIPSLLKSPPSPTNYNTQQKQTRLDFIDCDTCQAGLTLIKYFKSISIPDIVIREVIIQACQVLKLVEDEYTICRPTIESFATPVLRILLDRPEITTDDFCGILIPGCGEVNPEWTDWTVDIDPNKPDSQTPPPLDDNIERAQILQFTDIHLDLDYVEGTNSNCGKPEGCCRDGVGEGDTRAGKYGHFGCSLPEAGLDAIYEDAKARFPDPKFIFLTGDFIHSAIWLYNKEENSRHFEVVTNKLAATFPNTPIYPLVGNHEPNTVNMYPPENLWPEGFDLLWMYQIVSDPFKEWIPEDQLQNFYKSGYYTVRPDPNVPFRIITLNTNICYVQNFWLVYNTTDPTGQLQFLADTLLLAEKAKENVYILGHIQPGSGSCWPIWSEQFDLIIKRFEGIIKGQFYGHTHREYFVLAFDDDDNAISVSFNGPSGVTDRGNPAYKLYEVDGARGAHSTFEIIDHKSYILDLTPSNENGQAEFLELFNARDTFGLDSIRPNDLYELVVRMVSDDDLFQSYLRTHHRAGPNYNRCTDKECRKNTLCDLVTANSGDLSHCWRIRDMVDE